MISNPPRGKIYDRNGILLAYDEPSFQIYTYPYLIKKRFGKVKKDLENILQIKIPEKIEKKIKKGYSNKIIIKKRLTQTQVKKFIDNWQFFEGIFLEVQPRRVYTEYARYMPHLLGYVGFPSGKELG